MSIVCMAYTLNRFSRIFFIYISFEPVYGMVLCRIIFNLYLNKRVIHIYTVHKVYIYIKRNFLMLIYTN